jgi:hypothetical protein
MVNSRLSADTRFAVKDGHRLFALSPKTDLHSTISTDCSSIGKVHFNPLLSGSVIAFGSTPIRFAGAKERRLIFGGECVHLLFLGARTPFHAFCLAD